MRKLASIRKISNIQPIPSAEAIEVCTVDGWEVIAQRDTYNIEELVIYAEADSFIPHELAPFLTPEKKEPLVFKGIKGQRLRTIKLRGQLSQGLLLPLDLLPPNIRVEEGLDVSEVLGIKLYEPNLSTQLTASIKGSIPSYIPKTSLDRVQNLSSKWDSYQQEVYEVSEKLIGCSMTAVFYEDEFNVCSRNYIRKPEEKIGFWKASKKYHLEDKLRELGENLALQGELIGSKIEGNPYKLDEVDFYLFNVYDIKKGVYYDSYERNTLCHELGIPHVPILNNNFELNHSIKEILKEADGTSKLNKIKREGIVFKNLFKPNIQFKAISNKFLVNL